MRRRRTALWCLGVLALAGCLAGRGQTDLLTARLREQEQQLADTQSQLTSKDRELKQARHDGDELRRQLAQSGGSGLLPEQSDLLTRVSGIKINPMLTAGVDRDQISGDDALFVQFAPHDDDGELVKLPGAIDIAVLDPALPESHRTVAQWKFSAEESREHWVRGFLGTGYQFTLPWSGDPPRHTELVVHVRLKPVDGREFAATHVFRITPPVVAAGGATTVRKPAPTIEVDRKAGSLKIDGLIEESTNWTEQTMPVRR
jgi:hypothetical protein